MPCRGGSSAPAEIPSKIEKKLSLGGGSATPLTAAAQTPTYTSITALSSPLIDTIVTTTLIGLTTASVTTSASSSPTLTTPLLGEPFRTPTTNYPEASFSAITNALTSLPHSSSPAANTSSNSNQSTGTATSSSQQQSPSNVSVSRMSQSHVLTLPHIDEDDEDDNGLVPLRVSSYLVRNKVQNDNLINLNAGNNNNNSSCNSKNLSSNINNESSTTTAATSSSSLTPSPKIKVSRIKFTQQQQQPQQLPQSLSLSSSTSSESESSVATIHQQTISSSSGGGDNVSPNKMQAESGSIAELQKYHNKYLKNRRHTLANTAAITLRWVAKFNLLHESAQNSSLVGKDFFLFECHVFRSRARLLDCHYANLDFLTVFSFLFMAGWKGFLPLGPEFLCVETRNSVASQARFDLKPSRFGQSKLQESDPIGIVGGGVSVWKIEFMTGRCQFYLARATFSVYSRSR